MQPHQIEFLETCIEYDILKFGEFTLKSGRVSPYFFNAGLFNDGALLAQIARCYAIEVSASLKNEFMLYGPAYKGIPLVCATAIQLAQQQNVNIRYAYNRKEVKDHGEGGLIVGAKLEGDVVIVDDVVTAGTSISESIEIIQSEGANPCAVLIALDRQEVMDNEKSSSAQKIEQQHGIPVISLIKLEDLITYIATSSTFEAHFEAIKAYQKRYGIN